MASAPGKQKPSKGKDFWHYLTNGIWKEQPIWIITFVAFCGLMAVAMWVQSHNLWTEADMIPRVALRLVAPVTVLVLPMIVYAAYSWWIQRN